MAAICGDRTLAELAQPYDAHPNEIQDWKKRLMGEAESLFEGGGSHATSDSEEKVAELHARIGELTMSAISCPKRSGATDEQAMSASTNCANCATSSMIASAVAACR